MSSYKSSYYSITWMNWLIQKHGRGRWCLLVDADEFLVYDNSTNMSIEALTTRLDFFGISYFYTPLIELYPRGKLLKQDFTTDALYTMYVDATGYDRYWDGDAVEKLSGGMRRRVFSVNAENVPAISKTSLVKVSEKFLFTGSTHSYYPYVAARYTYAGALLHAKYLGDFTEKAANLDVTKEHYKGGREYHEYKRKMLTTQQSCDDIFYHPQISIAFRSADDLISAGLMPSIWEDMDHKLELRVAVNSRDVAALGRTADLVVARHCVQQEGGGWLPFWHFSVDTASFRAALRKHRATTTIALDATSFSEVFKAILRSTNASSINVHLYFDAAQADSESSSAVSRIVYSIDVERLHHPRREIILKALGGDQNAYKH